VIRLSLSLISLCLSCLSCLGCLGGCAGRAVDLDRAAPLSSAGAESDPDLVSSPGNVQSVWVDEQRLYWVAVADYDVRDNRFQSCLKTDCKHTTLSYAKAGAALDLATVAGGHVYWTTYGNFIYSCASEGCGARPVTVAQDPARPDPLFAYRGYAYWPSEFDIYRCPVSGCAATPEVVALGANSAGSRLVFDEARVYWMTRVGFMSAPLDGSEPPRLVLQFASDERALRAAGRGYLYWTVGKQVFRCAIASCDTSPPSLLATADVEIRELEIDDSSLYWLANGRIQSCPLAGCEHSLALTPAKVWPPGGLGYNVENAPPFAIDASHVYWIEETDASGQSSQKAIRKTAK